LKPRLINTSCSRNIIRENEIKLERINQIQEDSNLKSYEPGNILLVHLDFAKTSAKFNKKEECLINLLALFLMSLEM
jgi:hypothetical protein